MLQTFSVDPDNYRFGNWYGWYGSNPAELKPGFVQIAAGWADPQWGQPDGSSLLVTVIVPVWTWLAMGLPLPAFAIARRLKIRGRRLRGLCLTCGYDLRASPTRCPECGTEVPTS
jgi:hypothetical protein